MKQIPRIKYVIYEEFVDDLSNVANIQLFQAAPYLLEACMGFIRAFEAGIHSELAVLKAQQAIELTQTNTAGAVPGPLPGLCDSTPDPIPTAD